MKDASRKIIGRNVKKLREALNLSQLDFSSLIRLSRATLINIEAGKKAYSIDLIDEVAAFAHISAEDLLKENMDIPADKRESLITAYKGNPLISPILDRTPTIPYAIKYKLLVSDFLLVPREINEIRHFFLDYGWDFKGTSLQNALKRMSDEIVIKKHPTKAGTHTYAIKHRY